MYLGKIIEMGTTDKIINDPQHPYTIELINSVPTLDTKLVKNELDSETPKYSEFGCNYVNRCNKAMDVCAIKKPNLQNYKNINHQISCHLYTTQN